MNIEELFSPWPVRLVLAFLLGGLIGLERRVQSQPAGLRTQMLVAATACLVMMVSSKVAETASLGDPGRIANSVMVGIGFLGAGAIFRYGVSVRGLTTAASIWASAGIGLAVGASLVLPALVFTGLALAGLFLLDPLEILVTGKREMRLMRILAEDREGVEEEVRGRIEKHGVRIKNVSLLRTAAPREVRLDLLVSCPRRAPLDRVSRDIAALVGISRVEIE